ncbi:hypothetical protein NEOLI_003726 [Neolecta irregularis DAH-3]|uniref:Ubiquitin-like protease family profile domain-containing protein n=1 Tax=Neolecta irregularis (strain DAH-3) TaxID=1198029 RepID=A0A1U7LPN3_NEOID|nr:hypothetical protein NEOLI_003726 [Neolecta irregularis DAH-3]|eukprot:OLL24615.1 hypothetical protein NEOLI_003726 [Neolecta irregularis DAH-3]
MGRILKQSTHPAAHLFHVTDEESFRDALASLVPGSAIKHCLLDLYAVTIYQRLRNASSYESDTLFVSMFLLSGISDALERNSAMELETPTSQIRLYWRNCRVPRRVVFLIKIGTDHYVAVELDIKTKTATVYDPVNLCLVDRARLLISYVEKLLDSIFNFIGDLECQVLYGKCPKTTEISDSGICSLHFFCQLLRRESLESVDAESTRENLKLEANEFYEQYRVLHDTVRDSVTFEHEGNYFTSPILLGGPRPMPSRRWRFWRRFKRKFGCGSATDFAN